MESYFTNNWVIARDGDGQIIGFDGMGEAGKGGLSFVRMDGYVILPIEKYLALLPEEQRNAFKGAD